jgi:hypothetical protein
MPTVGLVFDIGFKNSQAIGGNGLEGISLSGHADSSPESVNREIINLMSD